MASSLVTVREWELISNSGRGRVIRVKPLEPFAQPDLPPLPRYFGCDRVLGGERGTEHLLPVLVRCPHHCAAALLADLFVARKRGCRICEIFCQAGGDDIAVLDGHDSALSQEREDRMAGVSEKRNAPLAPARHRPANHQRPFEGR